MAKYDCRGNENEVVVVRVIMRGTRKAVNQCFHDMWDLDAPVKLESITDEDITKEVANDQR